MKLSQLFLYAALATLTLAAHAQETRESFFNTITASRSSQPLGGAITCAGDTVDVEASEDEIVADTTLRIDYLPEVSLPLQDVKVNSPFGTRTDPINGRVGRMHNGLDLAAHYEAAYAMLPGTVIETGYSGAAGYYLTMQHGICVCTYCHLRKVVAHAGDHVRAGDIVAVTGNTGRRTTGPHLHISCRFADGGRKYFDPVIILKFVCDNMAMINAMKKGDWKNLGATP